ncbi:class III extradiol ring-cleavage dioxygenase [Accumulibacter sp.]|uniref:dioxygenase family protein n=1 Tax=Accumulibacter sp. TaxID=2053492 RepID=UPI00261C0A5B|nr:class III extradiol ring-cleavage dioxygenase [Accumulibacter sp.]
MTEHPYQAFLREALPASAAQPEWIEADGALPALYLSHGAPPLLESQRWMGELFGWAGSLPKPRNVLIVSAHWEAAPLAVSQPAAGTPLIYDFAGFDPLYHRMRYATPDATQLADRVVAILSHTRSSQGASSESARSTSDVYRHPRRGLDHGAWVPLMTMYPAADVPVLQLSLPTQDPERLLEIGRRLRPLRDEGTLIIGSGFMTHGLPFLTYEHFTGREPEPSWSRDFDAWAAEALAAGDIEQLSAFASKAPGMPYAHPTVEHFTPLFVTLGAASRPDQAVQTTIEGYFFGLSKRSFQVT